MHDHKADQDTPLPMGPIVHRADAAMLPAQALPSVTVQDMPVDATHADAAVAQPASADDAVLVQASSVQFAPAACPAEPIPPVESLHAAKDAAEFVARIFADVSKSQTPRQNEVSADVASPSAADAGGVVDDVVDADTVLARACGMLRPVPTCWPAVAHDVMQAGAQAGAEAVPEAAMEVVPELDMVPKADTGADAGDDGVPATAADVTPPACQAKVAVVRHRLHGRHVLVLGLGASGLAVARWCARAGAQVTVADTRDAPPGLATLRQDVPAARFVAGAFSAALIEGAGAPVAVYRSPGLAPVDIAPVTEAARAIGLPVGGELDLFAAALRDLEQDFGYRPKVLAITGTNGKTTVTSLTGQLLEHAGMTAAVAGNIGPTLLDTLTAAITHSRLPQAWVLELSSFQLDGVEIGPQGFDPTAAVVLNVTQDHLDWHGSMAAYAAAKARVYGGPQGTGLMVLNREDPLVADMLPPPVKVRLQKPLYRSHVTFGADLPRQPGDYGIETVSGMAWLVRAHEADSTLAARKSGRDAAASVAEPLPLQRLMPADALRIRGRHNATNALAALALASAAGCALAPLLYGLREYRGEPHRVEPVGTVRDVEYFDDSKGTNVGATVAALNGLGADRRIVLIAGGLGKGQDFAPLAAPVGRYVRAVVLLGRDAPLLGAALHDTGVPLLQVPDMEQAVQVAASHARPGDAVLLSPACASMDMFRDYAHRAAVFVDAVRALAEDAGQMLPGGHG